jgi:Tfp pilus assembly protein PilO
MHARTKSIVALALVIGCLAALYFLFANLWPAYATEQNNLKQAQTENDRLNKALASVQTFINGFKNQDQNVALAQLTLPNKSNDMANFSNVLSQAASASGVSLGNFSVGEIANGERSLQDNSIQVTDINISASGGYPSFKDFILRLERSLRLIDVYHASLRAESGQGAASLLNYNLRLRTYYQK